jgi:NADPH:quinone reductase
MAETENTMRAVAIDRFDGVDALNVKTLPVPEVGPQEVLIRVECSGVGVWDPFEMSGGFHEEMGQEASFPYVPGSDCAGTVVAVGDGVERFSKGDRVYAFTLLNPKGGSYAEYVAVDQAAVSPIPGGLSTDDAGVMPTDAMTALRGLEDVLQVQKGESLMIFGASGGIGHLAIQLAKRIGARVFAVASGDDGVRLASRLGADKAINGRTVDVLAAARAFAPQGLDAALVTAGGEATDRALEAVRDGGRVAFPEGVLPEPQARDSVEAKSYNGVPDTEAIEELNRLIAAGPFEVEVGARFDLDHAAEALRAALGHHLGKVALRPG